MSAGPEGRRQRVGVIVSLLLFILILVMIQLWLFAMSLERILAGDAAVAVPAAIVSTVVFLVVLWMLRGVIAVDR